MNYPPLVTGRHLFPENWNCKNIKERPCKDETFNFSECITLICIYYKADIFVGENII